MPLADWLQIASTLMILFGGGLALIQLRHAERARNRDAALAMLRSFQTPDFTRGMELVFNLPEGLDKAALEARVGDRMGDFFSVLTTIESIGVLVYRREIELELVDDFFSGPIVIAWRVSRVYLEGVRKETGRETIGEWVQWLAERFAERESKAPAVPAFLAHRDWKPR